MKKDCANFAEQCEKVIYQHAEINLPVSLIPDVTVGEIKIKAEHCPQVVIQKSKSSSCRHHCQLSIMQTITYKIPIQYSAHTNVGDICSEYAPPSDLPLCD